MSIHTTNLCAAFLAIIVGTAGLLTIQGCSSAPKRPAEIFTSRNSAVGQIDMANKAVSNGDFKNAKLFLDEAWRLAVAADDPDSRIRVLLARGNANFNEGNTAQANQYWNDAKDEAKSAGNAMLASAGNVYLARGTLVEGTAADGISAEERTKRAQEAKAVALAEMPNIRANVLYTAFAWKVLGLAEKELGNLEDAERAIRSAATIHESGRYLEDAAYDWYLIASIRSKGAEYTGAKTALDTAIAFDRRAENTNGLGMDWMAVGMVAERAGNIADASAAFRRSAEIFAAAGLADGEKEARTKLAKVNSLGTTAQTKAQ